MAEDPNHPAPHTVPPTDVGFAVPPTPPSTWPTVIGIIAIVFGVLGSLQGVLGLLAPLLNRAILRSLPASQQEIVETATPPVVWSIASSLIILGLGVLLLVAGIALLRRAASSRGLCLTWALLKIVIVLVMAVVNFKLASESTNAALAQMQQDPNVPPIAVGIMQGATGAGMCAWVVWSWALPIFLLIWFSRAVIKEQVASWSAARAEPL